MFGDWAMIIVLGIWMKVLTGSSSAAGLVFFVFALASLIAPVGGLVVDRLPKRRLMIATHVALAGVMCLLLLVHDRGDMWLLYLVTALYGLGGDIFGAARSAMIKAMVPDELLADANGASSRFAKGCGSSPRSWARASSRPSAAHRRPHRRSDFSPVGGDARRAAVQEPPAAAKEHHFLRELSAGITHIARTPVLRQLTIGIGRRSSLRIQRDAHLRGHERASTGRVVHRRPHVVPGHRLHRWAGSPPRG